MFDLRGKKALVTGSTQGIGFEIARLLSEHGATVYVNGATSEEKTKKAADMIPNSVPVRADLTDSQDLEDLYKTTGGVDILVLNASIQYKERWYEYSDEQIDRQIDCNIRSTYNLIKMYSPYMKENKWGRIVTIGSVNQYNNHDMLSMYGITKAAVAKMVRNIAKDLAQYGVTINNIAPGAICTPRNEEALADEEYNKKVVGSIPIGYVGSPEDVAPAVLFMCSDESKYITGADLVIDGGMSL